MLRSSPALPRVVLAAAAAAAAAAACDARATATSAAAGAGPAIRSRELESCASTADCDDGLRCLDQACRRAARSVVGDYLAAAGDAAAERGDVEAAIASYGEALARYEGDKLAVPPDVDCGYGAALARGRARKEHAELAARVLHRCVLAAPAGGALRRGALAALATLADAGLEPQALGRPQLADAYLTRAPRAPSSDKVAIAFAANPPPAGRGFAEVTARLGQPDLRAPLVACWEAYAAASHKPALAVELAVKAAFQPSGYDDEPGRFVVGVAAPATAAPGPEGAAEACVRAALEPALTRLATVREAFATRLTVTVK